MVTISKSLSSSHTTPNELPKSVPFTPDDELPQTAQALTGDYDSSKPVCPFLNNVTHKTTQLNKIPVRITTRTRQHSHIKSPRDRSTLRPIQVNKTAPSQPRLIPCCLVLNARSIAKPDAFPALCADIKCNNIDHFCCITETWLKPTIPSSLLCPPNFSIIRKDRTNCRGGGVAILCRNDWIMQLQYRLEVLEHSTATLPRSGRTAKRVFTASDCDQAAFCPHQKTRSNCVLVTEKTRP